MRISFVDSCLNGFKKWSDAQRGKGEPAAIEALPKQAEQRASVVRQEDAAHAAG
jgi:hypothetical protein